MSDPHTDDKTQDAAKPADEPQPQSQVSDGTAIYEQTHADDRKKRRYCKFAKAPIWIEAGCAVALVVITFFYTHYARRQANAAHETLVAIQKQYPELQKSADAAKTSADVASEALHSVQRAFVICKAIPDVTGITENGRVTSWLIKAPIQNSGATPTRGLRDKVNWVAPMYPLSDKYTFPDLPPPHGQENPTAVSTIAPQETILGPTLFIDPRIIDEFIAQHPLNQSKGGAKKGRLLYVYGWVRYHDIFKDTPERLTEFCYQLSIFQISFQGGKGGGGSQWIYCPKHNCIDDECLDYEAKTNTALK